MMARIKNLFGIFKTVVFGSIKQLSAKVKNQINGTKPPSGAAGLTVLCPIINDGDGQESHCMLTREYLQSLELDELSPMAKVPNTYLCRFYVLNDVFFEGGTANEEHLKSKYLVFSSNYYGDLDSYLEGMWKSADSVCRGIWKHCVAFKEVETAEDFVNYIKRCQVANNLFFNGSTGDSLDYQLKSLYLKQEFTKFAYENQGKSAADLQRSFQAFIERTKPDIEKAPTWVAGAHKEMIKT